MSKTGKVVCIALGVYAALCAIGGILTYRRKRKMEAFEAELASRGLHLGPCEEESKKDAPEPFDFEAEMAKLREMAE